MCIKLLFLCVSGVYQPAIIFLSSKCLLSLPALKEFLQDHPAHVPSASKERQIVVISDSKGRYLQDQICNQLPESDII